MKQSLLLLVSILFASLSTAQITLEHTFEANVIFTPGVNDFYQDVAMLPPSTFYYSTLENGTYTILIYNSDYSVYDTKTFIPPIIANYEISNVQVTKKVFNADDQYELIVTYNSNTYDNNRSKVILYDEQYNILKDLGSAYSFSVGYWNYVIDNELKILVYRNCLDENDELKTQTLVYNLNRTISSKSTESSQQNVSPYPNPANMIITLPYNIPNGSQSTMQIYDMQGKLIENKVINSNYNEILLNVSDYIPGTYIYKVLNKTYKFIVN